MSLLWPIFWIASILAAFIAFAVAAIRENSRARAAALARQPKSVATNDSQNMPDGSMENLDGFPAENFDFDDGSLKS